jgi:hypothetical protein
VLGSLNSHKQTEFLRKASKSRGTHRALPAQNRPPYRFGNGSASIGVSSRSYADLMLDGYLRAKEATANSKRTIEFDRERLEIVKRHLVM